MHETVSPQTLGRITQLELPLCRWLNAVRSRPLLWLFSAVSWLGNGHFWTALALLLVLADGQAALPTVFRLSLVSVLCCSLHRVLKSRTARPRPFAAEPGFHLTVEALDEFSFPSGHMLHAVGYTLVLAVYYPPVFWCVLPFTLLVAASRVVLGLHYPTDVVMGAALGATVATVVLWIW